MYPPIEIDISTRYLKEILKAIPLPFCLMGGWSVFFTVNESFKQATGRDYLGSKDIDLGFHFDPSWNRIEFEKSPFSNALTIIKAMGFEEESFRFYKSFNQDGRELTSEESHRLPQYDIFNLYIDVLVDSKDPKRFKLAGFKVLDEPLLSRVFNGKEYSKIELYEANILMPLPELLLEMKIKSFPDRTKDDKKTKDLADICALLLFSVKKFLPIDETLRFKYIEALTKTLEEDWKYIATMLDISIPMARRIAGMIR